MNEYSVYWPQSVTYGPIVFATPTDAEYWAEAAVRDSSERLNVVLAYEVVQRTVETVYSEWTPWSTPVPETIPEVEAPVEEEDPTA